MHYFFWDTLYIDTCIYIDICFVGIFCIVISSLFCRFLFPLENSSQNQLKINVSTLANILTITFTTTIITTIINTLPPALSKATAFSSFRDF